MAASNFVSCLFQGFLICTNEDTSARGSLGMTELREGFHLPLSTQARQEVRQLQDDTASTEIVSEGNDTSGCQTTHRPDSLNFSSEMQLSPILSLPLRRHHHEQFSCQQGAQSCHSSFFSISAHCICCKDLFQRSSNNIIDEVLIIACRHPKLFATFNPPVTYFINNLTKSGLLRATLAHQD